VRIDTDLVDAVALADVERIAPSAAFLLIFRLLDAARRCLQRDRAFAIPSFVVGMAALTETVASAAVAAAINVFLIMTLSPACRIGHAFLSTPP
jgi:hypothetical protein